MKARMIYLLLCAALLAGIVAADSGNGKAYQPAVHTLSANTFTYYAIEQDHSLCAWGDRYSQAPSLEAAVPILADIVSVDAGWRGCLAIDAQGRLWSVGEYMLDEPGSEPRLVMDHVADASAGLNHFVFLTADGDVYVCGRNTGYPVEVDETPSIPRLFAWRTGRRPWPPAMTALSPSWKMATSSFAARSWSLPLRSRSWWGRASMTCPAARGR